MYRMCNVEGKVYVKSDIEGMGIKSKTDTKVRKEKQALFRCLFFCLWYFDLTKTQSLMFNLSK